MKTGVDEHNVIETGKRVKFTQLGTL